MSRTIEFFDPEKNSFVISQHALPIKTTLSASIIGVGFRAYFFEGKCKL